MSDTKGKRHRMPVTGGVWHGGTYNLLRVRGAGHMNTIKAKCGHYVPAEGAPGSSARKAQEKRTCGNARCESRLPDKFTDRECEAYVWAWEAYNVSTPWAVDLGTKRVTQFKKNKNKHYVSLIEFAEFHGWRG